MVNINLTIKKFEVFPEQKIIDVALKGNGIQTGRRITGADYDRIVSPNGDVNMTAMIEVVQES